MTPTALSHHVFKTPTELAEALADSVVAHLEAAIARRGSASLALSGGSTPRRFLTELGARSLNWGSVVVTQVDERWVAGGHDRSNARMIGETLLSGPAGDAPFVPFYKPESSPETALPVVTDRLIREVPLPLDVIILGMGEDGHTASLFPDTPLLGGPDDMLGICHPDDVDDARITLTAGTILEARRIFLHIEGGEKLKTLDRALSGTDTRQMPVRAILHQTSTPVDVYRTG